MFRYFDRTLSSGRSSGALASRTSTGRPRFVLAFFAATAFAGSASAQLQWAPTRGQSGQTAVDPALASQDERAIAGLSCSTFSPNVVPSNSASPFGIPEERWTRELFQVLQARLAACTAAWDLNNRSFARSVLNNWGEGLVLRAENKRYQAQAAAERKRALLEQLRQIAELPSVTDQLRELAEFEYRTGLLQLSQAERVEISAVLMQHRARAEDRRQQEAAAEEERAKARQEALEAKAREEEQAFQARLTKFSAPVRTFVTRNPGVANMSENEAGAVLVTFYTMEVALRVCGSKFGGYRSELAEMTGRRKLFEQTLHEVQNWPDDRLKDARAKAGVESGTGRLAEMLSADRFKLMQTCDGALAYTSGVLNFER